MIRPPALLRTFRFVRQWGRAGDPVRESEVTVARGDRSVPASLFLPRGREPETAWVVLHGITRPGRAHPSLLRFARALAESGSAVLVPEVPEWIELELAPSRTLPTVVGALDVLDHRLGFGGSRTGLMGFSFGAPQAVAAAADPTLSGRLGIVAGFGGYGDLERTFRFLFTGAHAWNGETHRRRPDPYGRWIALANFLRYVPGWEDAEQLCEALRELTRITGERQVPAWDPVHDEIKDELAATLTGRDRDFFAQVAPPARDDPLMDDEDGARWATQLAAAAVRVEPLADPWPELPPPPVPVHLLHGRSDDLIPYTETLGLAKRLARQWPDARPHVTVTGRFAHAGEAGRSHPIRDAIQSLEFARLLSRILGEI